MAENNSSRTSTKDFGPIISCESREDSGDVLLPDPISDAPPAILMEPRDKLESSCRHSIKRKRRERCVVEGTWKVSFGLFQHHEGGRNYILEMHKVEVEKRDMYHVILQDNERKLDVRVKKLPLRKNVVPLLPILESIPIQPRYKLSLQERLEGWILQKRKRNASNTSDKVGYDSRGNTSNVHVPHETEKKIEGIPSDPANEELNKMVEEELEIFACALNNPIIDL